MVIIGEIGTKSLRVDSDSERGNFRKKGYRGIQGDPVQVWENYVRIHKQGETSDPKVLGRGGLRTEVGKVYSTDVRVPKRQVEG